ncbi:inducible metalloproteinase inhibitor protein [Helicoverpa armigera]|uniref:inducible metalloproteinase inhibitor protein n=1 Tax=Helicoverpa armigera TaxID=29058 RepID=UPI003082FDE4
MLSVFEKYILLSVSFVALSTGIFIAKEECPQNEEFLLCGSACPFNCSNPEGPVICSEDCIEGCFCKAGYLRNDNGTCVTTDQCVEPCLNDNETYDLCNGQCEPSCDDPEPICTRLCKGGCICSPGLLRDANGECVSVDKCANNTDVSVLSRYMNVINKILQV